MWRKNVGSSLSLPELIAAPPGTPRQSPATTPRKIAKASISLNKIADMTTTDLKNQSTPEKEKQRKLIKVKAVNRRLLFPPAKVAVKPESPPEPSTAPKSATEQVISDVKNEYPTRLVKVEQSSIGTVVYASSGKDYTFIPRKGTGTTPIFPGMRMHIIDIPPSNTDLPKEQKNTQSSSCCIIL